MICKGKSRALAVLPGAALFAAFFLPLEASALPSAAERCAAAPTSSSVINVKKKGAKGDGRADDTAAIQAAIDEIAGTGGTVLVPDGKYMVDAVGKSGLSLKSDMTLRLSAGAILKAIPTSSEQYSVLSIAGASNVTVTGGTLEGERKEHAGNSGEWGMGIHISRGAKRITISDVTSKNMWGDGFYVQKAMDVAFCAVTADNNRRQGLSIIDANRVLVTSSVFKNTGGTRPGAGIDLEPDHMDQKITNVRIEDSKFLDNEGAGILLAGKRGNASSISKVEITHNLFTGTLPIVIKDAPAVPDSAICRNRQITPQEPSQGLSPFASSMELVVLQNDCGHSPLQVRKQRKPK